MTAHVNVHYPTHSIIATNRAVKTLLILPRDIQIFIFNMREPCTHIGFFGYYTIESRCKATLTWIFIEEAILKRYPSHYNS